MTMVLSSGGSLPPKGYMGMSRDILGCHNIGGIKAKDAAKHPTMQRVVSKDKD